MIIEAGLIVELIDSGCEPVIAVTAMFDASRQTVLPGFALSVSDVARWAPKASGLPRPSRYRTHRIDLCADLALFTHDEPRFAGARGWISKGSWPTGTKLHAIEFEELV